MKKILSIVLTLALLASCVFVLPLTTSAAEASLSSNDWTIEDYYSTIFDSNDYPAPTHKNPAINDSKTWLGKDSWVSSNTALQDSIYMGYNGETDKILERNGVNAVVTDFEWQFQFIADANTKGYLNTSFVFHVNENSNINSYSERNNLLAVTYYGSDFRTDKNGVATNAFVIEYGGNSYNSGGLGNMRPFDYDSSKTPWAVKENSYKKLDDNSAAKEIDIGKYTTINIKMEGRNIKVSFWQTDDKENTYREFSVTMHKAAYEKAKYGDFAIISAHSTDKDYYGISNCNYRIKDMQISRPHLIFDSSKNSIAQNPGNSSLSSVGGTITSSNGVYTLPVYSATDELIEASVGGQVNVKDFVWQTDFSVSGTNANFAILSFNFHVDKEREEYPSKLPGDTGISAGNAKRQNMISATVYGEAIGASTADQNAAGQSAVVLQSSSTASTTVAGCSTATITKDDSSTIKRATSFTPLTKALAVNTYYTIRIVLSGKNLYTYIWETNNKTTTLRSVYQTLTEEQYNSASSGDFAIVVDNRAVNIKNMKIWDSTDVLKSDEDYSEYTDILDPTVYDFEDDNFGGIVKGAGQDDVNLSIEDSKLQFGDDDDKGRVTAINFDGGNNTMKDFVAIFDYSTAVASGSDSNWLVDRLVFRDVGGSSTNQYQLQISRQGRNNTNQNYDTISIIKFVEGVSETIASASLSRSLNNDTNYKIKLEVIGNVFKVYFAVDEVFDIPVLMCTDDAYAEGYMYWYHNRGITYIDNFTLYDITATEIAAEINNVTANVKRGMDEQLEGLYTLYSGMHTAQQAKLADYIATLDTAKDTLNNIEMLAHDINATGDVDICDLVAMSMYLNGATDALKNFDADPMFDGELNDDDIPELRLWLLGSKKKITNILCIGNSYTRDTMTYVAQLADSIGINDFHFANLFSPGRSVPQHYASALGVFGENYPDLVEKYKDNSYYQNGDYLYWYETYTKDGRTYKEHTTIKEALFDKEWDIVFFQTSPTGAAFLSGFNNLDKLMDFVRKYEGDDVKFMWHNSWAYANLDYDEGFAYDDTVKTTQCTYAAFAGENGEYSQTVMHNLIVNKLVTQFGDSGTYADSITIDDVIPSGMAIQNARESGVDFKVGNEKYWDLTRDGYHLSMNMGRYIGSLTLIRQFTGEELVYSDNLFRTLENGTATEAQVRASIDAVNTAFAQRDALK